MGSSTRKLQLYTIKSDEFVANFEDIFVTFSDFCNKTFVSFFSYKTKTSSSFEMLPMLHVIMKLS